MWTNWYKHRTNNRRLVHAISIQNVRRYAIQVNRQKLNEIIDALQRSHEDLNRLFNITDVLTQNIRYQQIYNYMCTILPYLRISLTYMRQVALHSMDYVDMVTTNILSPNILPVEDLRNIHRHIECVPSTMHLPISLDDTFHFYWYPNRHLMFPYKTEHNSFKYMEFPVYMFHIVTYQPSIKLIKSI